MQLIESGHSIAERPFRATAARVIEVWRSEDSTHTDKHADCMAMYIEAALDQAVAEEREAIQKYITEAQLYMANHEKIRPDIKQGHWIASADISSAIDRRKPRK